MVTKKDGQLREAPSPAAAPSQDEDAYRTYTLTLRALPDERGEPMAGTAELRYKDRVLMGIGTAITDQIATLVMERDYETQPPDAEDIGRLKPLPAHRVRDVS